MYIVFFTSLVKEVVFGSIGFSVCLSVCYLLGKATQRSRYLLILNKNRQTAVATYCLTFNDFEGQHTLIRTEKCC